MAFKPTHNLVRLPAKANVAISSYVYAGSEPLSPSTPLVVFLNSLSRSQAAWRKIIAKFRAGVGRWHAEAWLVTYDRFGQGETEHDPAEGSDAASAARDLRELLEDVVGSFDDIDDEREVGPALDSLPLVLVSSGIGGAIARLYHAQYGLGGVRAHLFLDHFPTDMNLDVFFPSCPPEEKGADGPVESQEGIRIDNLPELLPRSDAPPLEGEPWVTVATHDAQVFAKGDVPTLGRIPSHTLEQIAPLLATYQSGLVKLTIPSRARGPDVIQGAGLHIEDERPDWVLCALEELVEKAMGEIPPSPSD